MRPLEAKIAADWPVDRWRDVTVVVAVSGGADSVALLRALTALRSSDGGSAAVGRVVVAHLNHRWRGQESDDDARFVRRLAKQLGLPVFVGRARERREGDANEPRTKSEDAARRLRYRFLSDVAGRVGARYVVVAHTADDQIETVLQRVLRGTGLSGLGGIPRVRRLNGATSLIRPMLGVSRADVISYLESLAQPYRTDRSNTDERYTRNRIRHELLPLARSYYAGVDHALLRLAQLAAEAQQVIARQAEEVLEAATNRRTSSEVALDVAAFEHVEPYLVREALRRLWQLQGWPRQAMGLEQWNDLAGFITAGEWREQSSTAKVRTFPGNVRAKREGGLLTLTRPPR